MFHADGGDLWVADARGRRQGPRQASNWTDSLATANLIRPIPAELHVSAVSLEPVKTAAGFWQYCLRASSQAGAAVGLHHKAAP